MSTQRNVTFVLSNIDIEADLPAAICSDHFVRRASSGEIDEIEAALKRHSAHLFSSDPAKKYKATLREKKLGEGQTSFSYEKQPSDSWRFWVVETEMSNPKGSVYVSRNENIQATGLLLPVEIELGMSFFYSKTEDKRWRYCGYMGVPTQILERQLFSVECRHNARCVSPADLQQWTKLDSIFNALPPEARYVRRAMQSYNLLRSIPPSSELLVLGYFAIIESLVTHAPRSVETLDSINHQIVNKLILLGKRYQMPVPHADYFQSTPEETLWKLLYKYRSQIAHGGEVEFDGTFQILKSQETVRKFLKQIVKQLLIYGLNEHEFLSDLKKC